LIFAALVVIALPEYPAGYLLGYVGSATLMLASVLYAVAGVLVPVAEWYAHYQ
jgi:hypothetical protein